MCAAWTALTTSLSSENAPEWVFPVLVIEGDIRTRVLALHERIFTDAAAVDCVDLLESVAPPYSFCIPRRDSEQTLESIGSQLLEGVFPTVERYARAVRRLVFSRVVAHGMDCTNLSEDTANVLTLLGSAEAELNASALPPPKDTARAQLKPAPYQAQPPPEPGQVLPSSRKSRRAVPSSDSSAEDDDGRLEGGNDSDYVLENDCAPTTRQIRAKRPRRG
jgi:hypothetical protein